MPGVADRGRARAPVDVRTKGVGLRSLTRRKVGEALNVLTAHALIAAEPFVLKPKVVAIAQTLVVDHDFVVIVRRRRQRLCAVKSSLDAHDVRPHQTAPFGVAAWRQLHVHQSAPRRALAELAASDRSFLTKALLEVEGVARRNS